jgi:hypothetical protein
VSSGLTAEELTEEEEESHVEQEKTTKGHKKGQSSGSK